MADGFKEWFCDLLRSCERDLDSLVKSLGKVEYNARGLTHLPEEEVLRVTAKSGWANELAKVLRAIVSEIEKEACR